MRLDHIAYRTKDRKKTAQFFINAFNYRIQEEFDIDFGNNQFAKCIALEPPEKPTFLCPWTMDNFVLNKSQPQNTGAPIAGLLTNYHMAPEIFISDGNPTSIVGKWVEKREGIGGIHHIAYQVDSVEATVKLWKEKGYAEFSTPELLVCGNLKQIFTKPSELTGIIYEFIERKEYGFCKENVKNLMESTKDL